MSVRFLLSVTAIVIVSAASPLRADEPGNEDANQSDQSVEQERARFAKDAGRFSAVETETEEPLTLLPQSVLNWSNPERKTFVGGLFLWVKQSRPMIALCVYPNAEMYDFEFQSLADRPLTVYERGSPVWQPSEAGIVWHTLTAKELTPSRSPLVRRRQMRQIASQFTAKLVPPNRPEKPLRLQDAPVYRYPPKKLPDGCLDGGVFCFVLGTDPELLLIIEAVKEDDDVSVYRYAVARTTFVPMQVYHSTDLIFEVGWASRRFSGTYNVIQHAK